MASIRARARRVALFGFFLFLLITPYLPANASGSIFEVVTVSTSGAHNIAGIGDTVTDLGSFDCLDNNNQVCLFGETVQIPSTNIHNHVVILSFYLKKVGTPTGIIHAAIFALPDPSDPAGVPVLHNGAAGISTNGIDSSSLTTSFAYYNFTFADTSGRLIEAFGVWFLAAIVGSNGGFDGSNYVDPNWNTGDTYGGYTQRHVKSGGAQVFYTDASDMPVKVYADVFGAVPPAGEPSTTPQLVDFIIIMLIIFTPAMALFGASRSIFLMLLGFLIGSGIAASTGLVSEWLPVLIGIALLGYIWQKGDRGGES